MKKLLLTALTAVATLSVAATNLWTGSCTFANYSAVVPEDRPVLDASLFASANVGDDLVVTLTNNPDDKQSWHQCELWTPDISASLCQGVHITEGVTQAVFGLTEDLLAKLRDTGCALAGTGYTVTSIDLTGFNPVIWEGECTVASWNADPVVNLPGSKFSGVEQGLELVFDVHIITPGEYACIQVDKSTWTAGAFGTTEISDATSEVVFRLTPELHAELQKDGINITGMNFVLTKIYVREVSTPDVPGHTLIWEGSLSTGNWASYLEVDAARCAAVVAGDQLVFTVTATGNEASLCLKQRLASGWEEMPSDSEWGNYLDLPEGDSQAVFAVNQEAAATIVANGLVVAGKDFTVTRIERVDENAGITTPLVSVASGLGNEVYNIQGVKIQGGFRSTLPAGLYIVNGKKVMKR